MKLEDKLSPQRKAIIKALIEQNKKTISTVKGRKYLKKYKER